jgi:dipeptidyl aminopeptidase/acylaminoacyl peptidase
MLREHRAALIAACLITPIASLSQAAQTPGPTSPPKTPITHEKLWLMKRVGAPDVSPDGKWTVFPVLEPSYDPDKEMSDLWIVATDGSSPPHRLTHTRASEGGVTWSPDSKTLAFTSKREGDDAEQIYLLELSLGGEARRLTNLSSGASNPQWRPDGKAVLFESAVFPNTLDDEANKKIAAERKALKYNVHAYEHFPVRYWNRWLDDRQPTIMVQGVQEGSTAKDILSPTAFARATGFSGAQGETNLVLSATWSPDGKEVLFVATSEHWNSAFSHVAYHLYRMPAEGGAEPRLATPAAGEYSDPTFSPDGKSLFFKYAPQDEEIYHQEQLQRVAWPVGGEASTVTRNFDRMVSGYVLTSDSRTIYIRTPEAGRENLYRVSASGGQPALVVGNETGGYTNLASAQKSSKPVLIATYGSSVSPQEVVRIDPAARKHDFLTHFDTAAAAAIDWSPPQHFYFTSAKGRTIHNMIVLPPAFDPTKKYPLLVFIHGGAASFNPDQIGLRWNYHLLGAPGYVLLMTDYTGSTSFGEKFAQAIKLDPLKTPGDEINQAVDEALKKYSFIDGARMCASGASYGGHLSNWIEATTTRYKCIVSHAGEVDLATQWGESDAIYEREVTNGGPPWAGSPIWRDQSPITYAANWKTPMLLSIGEKDFRVPIGNTLENWATLQRMHVPSRLLVWPDAWHWILKAEDSRHFYDEVHAWLAKYLKDPPAPAAH